VAWDADHRSGKRYSLSVVVAAAAVAAVVVAAAAAAAEAAAAGEAAAEGPEAQRIARPEDQWSRKRQGVVAVELVVVRSSAWVAVGVQELGVVLGGAEASIPMSRT